MSKTVKFTLQTASLPNESEPFLGSYVVSLVGGVQQSISIGAAPFEGEFVGVAAGNYTISAQALDVNGNAVGAAVACAEFNVPADTQNIGLVQSITISVA